MLFPQRDESRPLSRFPIVLVLIVTANIVVFLVELTLGDSFILRFSMTPADIIHGKHLDTLVTSMFLHANILHILGNMMYLWVFGDELEANYLGPIRFALFYLVCGLAADFLQIAVNPNSTVPNLGASGAIAGVLGGFLVVFPRDRILVYIFPFWHARITALVLIGFWFLTQLISGVGSITSATQAGVAYFPYRGLHRRGPARQDVRRRTPGRRRRLFATAKLEMCVGFLPSSASAMLGSDGPPFWSCRTTSNALSDPRSRPWGSPHWMARSSWPGSRHEITFPHHIEAPVSSGSLWGRFSDGRNHPSQPRASRVKAGNITSWPNCR
jgi:membrane associated rhomboid family serine protease